MDEQKTYVWSFWGRLNHWLLVFSFFACYISSFYEELLTLHIVLGIVVFGLFIKKIFWGLVGPKYARWSDYKFSLKDLKFYFVEKARNRYREIEAGHNPASSWFSFLITWIGIICCVVGFVLYGIQEGNGLFSFLNEKYYMQMQIYEDIHIIFAYILMVMVFFHIAGVFIEHFYHKTNIAMTMITGYKKAKGEDTQTNYFMTFLDFLYSSVFIFVAVYVYLTPNNVFIKSEFEKIDYKALHSDFYYECSDCHNLIPPHLLPKESWIKLMKEQSEHFEEDLELEKPLANSIRDYLVKNSAENSTREVSYKLKKEIGNSGNYTITKTSYWKKLHKNIPDDVFKSDEIESKSNCVACHKDFESGILSDENITYK